MRVTINRRARRHIAKAGGALTIEARSDIRCWCTARLQATTGEPEDPTGFLLVEAAGIRVFARGLIEGADGTVRPANSVVPRRVRVRDRHGCLAAHTG